MTAFRDFGWWSEPDGRRRLLTWWRDGAVTLDGPGGIEVLGYIDTEDEAQAVFAEWADHSDDRGGVAWVRAQVQKYQAAHSCRMCGGARRLRFPDPFIRGHEIVAACPACTTAASA